MRLIRKLAQVPACVLLNQSSLAQCKSVIFPATLVNLRDGSKIFKFDAFIYVRVCWQSSHKKRRAKTRRFQAVQCAKDLRSSADGSPSVWGMN